MVLISYILTGIYILWLIFLSVFDIKIRKVPIWGIVVAGVISAGNLVIRICKMTGWFAGESIENTTYFNSLFSIVLGLLPGFFLIILSIATKKVGLADGILLCFIGFGETYLSVVIIFCISSFLMSLVSIVLLILKRVKRNTPLPYIPFLAFGYLLKVMLFALL